MPKLVETLCAPEKLKQVVSDCCMLIDQEVGSKSGLSGLALKGGYKLVKSFKPGFVPDVVQTLLPEFCTTLDPIVQDARAQSRSIRSFFDADRGRVAESLLAITDERSKRSKHAAIKGAYDKLRGMAKKHVEEAVPRISALIEKHAA